MNCEEDFIYYLEYQFKKYYHEFFVIVHDSLGVIGFIYSHNYNKNALHAMLTTVIDPRFYNLGFGSIASLLFLDFLFGECPIRKVFLAIYGYNQKSLRNCQKAGVIQEGCLKEYRYHAGKYHDLYYLSIAREDFYNLHFKRIQKLRIKYKFALD